MLSSLLPILMVLVLAETWILYYLDVSDGLGLLLGLMLYVLIIKYSLQIFSHDMTNIKKVKQS